MLKTKQSLRTLVLAVVIFLTGCAGSAGQPHDREVDLFRGVTARVPPGVAVAGPSRFVLEGVAEEVASIFVLECPAGAPAGGCLDNHRALALSTEVVVAGRNVGRFEADYHKPSAAADSRTWLELHTVLPLPSGQRIDIVGQVLKGSGQEEPLRSAYEALLTGILFPK